MLFRSASMLGSTLLGKGLRIKKFGAIPGPLGRWTGARDVPMLPDQTFRAWWKKNRGGEQ